MSARTEVLLWAQRILAKTAAAPHVLLEITANATAEQAQEAFHQIARLAHPDLHRTTLSADELEAVTTAYARVAGAYQELRSQRMQTTRLQPIKKGEPEVIPGLRPSGASLPQRPLSEASAASAAGAMNGKALVHYRKAELCLRRGDLKTAVLQIKMAIAGDPQSTFLRSALTEIEAALAKK